MSRDPEPNAVHIEGTFERPRSPSIVIVAILAGILLAVVKPWSFGDAGAPASQSSAVRSAAPGAVGTTAPVPSPQVDPNAMLCFGADAQQVVAYERSANVAVSNWIALDDVPVTGALDPNMAWVTIISSHVVGLGICGAHAGDGVPVAGRILNVQLVTATPDGAVAHDLGRPRQITLELGGRDAAVLYGSPQELVGAVDATPLSPGAELPALRPWSTGTYAIAYAFAGDLPGVARWLRIDLVAGAGRSVAPGRRAESVAPTREIRARLRHPPARGLQVEEES